MKDRLFIDTNVMLDLLAAREPFLHAAQQIFSLADTKQCEAVVASMSFATCAYILHKKLPHDELTALLRSFSQIVTIAPIDERAVQQAIAPDSTFLDIEDAMQYHVALQSKSDVIITRNKRDFANSDIPVLTPDEYLSAIL